MLLIVESTPAIEEDEGGSFGHEQTFRYAEIDLLEMDRIPRRWEEPSAAIEADSIGEEGFLVLKLGCEPYTSEVENNRCRFDLNSSSPADQVRLPASPVDSSSFRIQGEDFQEKETILEDTTPKKILDVSQTLPTNSSGQQSNMKCSDEPLHPPGFEPQQLSLSLFEPPYPPGFEPHIPATRTSHIEEGESLKKGDWNLSQESIQRLENMEPQCENGNRRLTRSLTKNMIKNVADTREAWALGKKLGMSAENEEATSEN